VEIVIKGSTPPKKNSRQLFVKNGRIVNIPSAKHKEWEKSALLQLKSEYQGQFEGKVTIAYQFYFKDNRKKDLDNAIASVNDVLVKAGLLEDDCWQMLAIGAADAEIDKANPRVVLWVTED
jgi:Holliday junction resolvase RusA-like endonuclease